MENNKTVRPKSGRGHLWVEVVMSLWEVLDYMWSHVTGKIYDALDRCMGFIKNLVAAERCNVTVEYFERGPMSE